MNFIKNTTVKETFFIVSYLTTFTLLIYKSFILENKLELSTKLVEKLNISQDDLKSVAKNIKEENFKHQEQILSLTKKANENVLEHFNYMKIQESKLNFLVKDNLIAASGNESFYLKLIVYGTATLTVIILSYFLYKKLDGFSDTAKDILAHLPGSNSAEGTETIGSLGLKIITNVKHGQANSIVIDTLLDKKYASLYEYLTTKSALNITTSEIVKPLITDGGIDITSLL